ncbi:MAG: hypothetical protein R6V08_03355 [Desulfuromonadales bacterium]
MKTEETISLDCPCCGELIYKPLSWFKKTYSTCPACDGGLASRQFEAAVEEIEKALDDHVEEILYGKSSSGCCGCH